MTDQTPYEQARELGTDRSKHRNLLGYFSSGRRGCATLVAWVLAGLLTCSGLLTECAPESLVEALDFNEIDDEADELEAKRDEAKRIRKEAKEAARAAKKAGKRQKRKQRATRRGKKSKRGKRGKRRGHN
jgi:hypothetical protein